MSVESLCYCGHLTSDHESTDPNWPTDDPKVGSPCNRCQADPDKEQRRFYGMYCTGYREWPIEQIPHPGTWPAREVGCTCPSVVNLDAVKNHGQPVYDDACQVHVWVCKRTLKCSHRDPYDPVDIYYMDHVGTHAACEHCTIPRIECESCGKVWGDWRVSPFRNGWEEFYIIEKHQSVGPSDLIPSPVTTTWRCETCRSSQSPATP